MGGSTGSLGTYRSQSGVNGSRTLGSILASDSLNGAGSCRRIFQYYSNPRHNRRNISPFTLTFGLSYGEFSNQARFLYRY